uniref:YEATS domain-containing protein n=1 Tax=Glossina pallidipes TaxID=7398 RepID=A0A1A9ZD72_GLOPL
MASYNKASPQKRKHKTDYANGKDNENIEESAFKNEEVASKKRREEAKDVIGHDQRLQRVCGIIEREFQSEIHFKQQQLQEIDERLSTARQLLESLRYNIVAEYYHKQDLSMAAIDAATMKDKNTLFQQMHLHPSVKRLIGKKPKELCELWRSFPRRVAAQNAKESIRVRNQGQKREERKLQQIIREQGIVIDHTQEDKMNNYMDVKQLLSNAQQNLKRITSTSDTMSSSFSMRKKETSVNVDRGNALNAARLNNKIKYLIVVGNVSKYIGDEMEQGTKAASHVLTHKWLVYVQAKETSTPLEHYVKKVRFFLHHSYRPNDVVDVHLSPFQVARRGWGEFPIRVQLFFHTQYYQKPVQLIHNIVLDKTLSGLQTLGAETVMEVWLRNIPQSKTMKKDPYTKMQVESKQHIMHKNEDFVDDNLLDFLNKIEATPSGICADIEKIQPTVVVTEPLNCKLKTLSRKSSEVTNTSKQLESSLEQFEQGGTERVSKSLGIDSLSMLGSPQKSSCVTKSISDSTISTTYVSNNEATEVIMPSSASEPATTNVNLSQQLNKTCSNTSIPTTITATIKSPIASNKKVRILTPAASVASVVQCATLPIVSNKSDMNGSAVKPTFLTTSNGTGSKQIFQKKLVQLIDSSGKVKYIQMLVATSSTAVSPLRINNVKATSAVSTKTYNTVTNITQSVNANPLKPTNGLTSSTLTTKPNIVKIKLDELQSKPQIFTFSTSVVNSTRTTLTTTVPSNTSLTFLNVLKTNSNPTTTSAINTNSVSRTSAAEKNVNGIYSKNVVFHKEGKLCIIDPLQMKLKQQQKKQISLLKPQTSWLKQKQEQMQRTAPTLQAAVAYDHSYAPLSPNISKDSKLVLPQVHHGLRQNRANSTIVLQFKELQRQKFENKFLKQNFTSTREAVEYLLRRLQLIANKYPLEATAYPFVSQTAREFQLLTAFKQRSCEWLRAKTIAQLIQQHKNLQKLEKESKGTFWSTREIAKFARQYAYTPIIKSLPPTTESKRESSCQFSAFVQSELKRETDNLPFITLSDHLKIDKWMDQISQQLGTYDMPDNPEFIDVDGLEKARPRKGKNKIFDNRVQRTVNSDLVLTFPKELENECELVSYISKELHLNIPNEEVESNVWFPAVQTILGHCLHVFLEKLLRQSIATKLQNENIATTVELSASDIIKVLCNSDSRASEFDFLTNNNFGAVFFSDPFQLHEFKQEKC